MAAVLGIHRADIKVVAVYEGSTIVDFFVQQAENIEDALDLEKVAETFTEAVSTMDSFMGSPVLGAVAQGAAVVTMHAADLLTDDDDAIFLWDLDDDEEDVTPEDKEVQIEVVYKQSNNLDDDMKGSKNLQFYIILLIALIVVILIIIVALCIYNRYAMKTHIEKTQARTLAHRQGNLERRISEQYDPKKNQEQLISMATNIEQLHTGRHSSRPLNKKQKANEAPTTNSEMIDPGVTTDVRLKEQSDMKRRELDDSVAANPIFEDETQVKASPMIKHKKKAIVKKNDESPF